MKKWKIATVFALCTASLAGLGFSTFIISESAIDVPNIQVGADNVYYIGEYLNLDKTQGSGNDAVDEIILTNFGFLNEDEFVTNASVSFYLSFDLKHYYDETKTNFVLFNVTLTNKSMNTALFNVIDSIVLSYDSTYDYKNQISSTLIRDSASIVGQFPSITTASIQSDFLHLKLILNFNVSTIDSFKQIYTDFLQNPLRLSLKIDLGSIAA